MTFTPSLDVANEARAKARFVRAARLYSLANGSTTVVETIAAATDDAGRPLLRLTLRQLLLAQKGWGEQRTAHVIGRTLSVIGAPETPTRKLTVAWLIDPRSGGRRIMAFCDALSAKDGPPWPGFPFAPHPDTPASISTNTESVQ